MLYYKSKKKEDKMLNILCGKIYYNKDIGASVDWIIPMRRVVNPGFYGCFCYQAIKNGKSKIKFMDLPTMKNFL